MDAFWDIHVLINNAQASAYGVTIAQHTTEQFDLVVYSGLYATFYYMKACYPFILSLLFFYQIEYAIMPLRRN